VPIVYSNIPLQERDAQISEVISIVTRNIENSHKGDSAKAEHEIPVFTGGAGIGKVF